MKHGRSRLERLAEGLAGHWEEVAFQAQSGPILWLRAVPRQSLGKGPQSRACLSCQQPGWYPTVHCSLRLAQGTCLSRPLLWVASAIAAQEVSSIWACARVSGSEMATACYGQIALELLEELVSLWYRERGMHLSLLRWGSAESLSSQTRCSCLHEIVVRNTQLNAGCLYQGCLHTL